MYDRGRSEGRAGEWAASDLATAAAPHDSLSDREFQILRLFGAGKSVREIAEELSLSVPTVSTYRARVLEKPGLRTTAELVRYAILNKLTFWQRHL